MSLAQTAIVLEISGFILASVFAGILLEKGAIGNLSDRLSVFLMSKSGSLEETFPSPPPQAIQNAISYTIQAAILGLGITSTIVGLSRNESWLFWVGMILATLVLISPIVLAFFFRHELYPSTLSIPRILSTQLARSLLGILVIIPAWLLLGSLVTLKLLTKSLAGKDMLKKALLLFGTVLLLSGLIVELLATP